MRIFESRQFGRLSKYRNVKYVRIYVDLHPSEWIGFFAGKNDKFL